MRLQHNGGPQVHHAPAAQHLAAPCALHARSLPQCTCHQVESQRSSGLQSRTQPHLESLRTLRSLVACHSLGRNAASAASTAAAGPAEQIGSAGASAGVEAPESLPQMLQRIRDASGLQIPAGCEVCQSGDGTYLGMAIQWRLCVQVRMERHSVTASVPSTGLLSTGLIHASTRG